jgi:hypothetical protein
VNKWDLNGEMTARIEDAALREGAAIAGRIRYDRAFTPGADAGEGRGRDRAPCAGDIRNVWERLGL